MSDPNESTLESCANNWDGLARQLMLAYDCNLKTPKQLLDFLKATSYRIPDWMLSELKPYPDHHVISKGTRVVLIYRAMIDPTCVGEKARVF